MTALLLVVWVLFGAGVHGFMLMGMPAVQALRGRAVWVLVALVLLLWPVVLLLMAGINVGAAIRVHRALGARR